MEEYTVAVQKYYIQFLLSSNNIFARAQNIVQPEYFDAELRQTIEYIKNYANENNVVPLFQEVNAKFDLGLQPIENISHHHEEGFLPLLEGFCRHRAIENVIRSAPPKMGKQQYSDIENDLKNALLISLQKDLGTDYYADPRSRIEIMLTRNATVSTGWRDVDHKLYGGTNRGEITIFAGNSGMGKSLFLQNMAVNWSLQGLFVVYVTLELSEELTAMRLDSMLTGIATREIMRNIDQVEYSLATQSKKQGPIRIKYMSSGSSANDLRAYLRELEIKTGRKPDAICIDYLDLMFPNNKKVDPSNLFIKDKFVTEELRSLAVDCGALMATASQLGRSAIEAQDHDQSHIAGGISKINTADNVITIYASAQMKERGEYQLQFIKTRSSNGVGSKVHLKFNPVTLRIVDQDEGYDPNMAAVAQTPPSSQVAALKGAASMKAEASGTGTTDNRKKIDSLISGLGLNRNQ